MKPRTLARLAALEDPHKSGMCSCPFTGYNVSGWNEPPPTTAPLCTRCGKPQPVITLSWGDDSIPEPEEVDQ